MAMLNNQRVIMGLAPIRCLISVMLPSGYSTAGSHGPFFCSMIYDDLPISNDDFPYLR